MNEGENLLIVTLIQMGFINNDSEIKSFMHITNEDFFKILVKCCRKIINIKELDSRFPDVLPKEMNLKYKEAQKMVEFIKSIGYKVNLNLNNILFPSIKDMQKIFEFILELITNLDSNLLEVGQNFSEKNLASMKVVKTLNAWSKESWIMPELNHFDAPKRTYILTSKLSSFKKNSYNTQLKANKSQELFKKFYEYYQNSENILEENKEKVVIVKSDQEIDSIRRTENIGIINNRILKSLAQTTPVKSVNQQLIEFLNIRQLSSNFSTANEKENMFINNVKIIESLYCKARSEIIRLNNSEKENNENRSRTDSFKTKIDNIMLNYEKDREVRLEQINELNAKLVEQTKILNDLMKKNTDYSQKKNEIEQLIKDKTNEKKDIVKEIESKLEIFEKINKIEKKEENIDDLGKEVEVLEKRYNEMTSDWNEYYQQIQSRKEELTNLIETTKKEYKFKYDKISLLKSEIEEINNKVALKQELASFLSDEHQKIPIDINRNIFINKISTLTNNISHEKQNISGYIKELSTSEGQISNINDTFKRVDNELEDKLFQEAKSQPQNKEFYSLFIRIRDGYNIIQKNIIDSQNVKNKLKEIEIKLDDYNLKTKSLDLDQLKKQVDELKIENKKK